MAATALRNSTASRASLSAWVGRSPRRRRGVDSSDSAREDKGESLSPLGATPSPCRRQGRGTATAFPSPGDRRWGSRPRGRGVAGEGDGGEALRPDSGPATRGDWSRRVEASKPPRGQAEDLAVRAGLESPTQEKKIVAQFASPDHSWPTMTYFPLCRRRGAWPLLCGRFLFPV